MLYALVNRHEKALDTISWLVKAGRAEHAAAIVRMAYEAFLNFYIDWLSPQFFGPRIQMLSKIRAVQASDRASRTKSPSELTDILKKFCKFLGFLETVARKAEISPLGNLFHHAAYPPLSSIMHQTYGNLEAGAISFDTASSADNHAEIVSSLVIWMDLITAALISRVKNEVGEGVP